ncbi:pyridoxal phosphate-dependent transferase [Penicillium macrosclerotiorum]|uniref:pyridoxal phosphate-dependent transferase n=1 Tax=Penicillium macrosclerotiorum TaxID=303699 RepID=UPI0025467908|nr:pyridoxal phosphate-dependent transferase [Penicillium macrosclerotiorum]KAJ5679065.1 pyridoxal phosphate-dependent transferase [Penicillium macrosclerotiorum]
MPHESNFPISAEIDGSTLKQVQKKTELHAEMNSPTKEKPTAKSFHHRFSVEGLALAPTPLKDTAKAFDFENIIPMSNGRPAPEFLPWKELSMNVTKCDTGTMSCMKGEDAFDLAEAMDYSLSAGNPKLVNFFTEHVNLTHSPPYRDRQTCLSIGSTSAIERALRIFCDRGDSVLVEQYTYPGVTTATDALGINLIGIKMDDEGLDPIDLDAKLNSWDAQSGKKPFILYMVPCGQNPTGVTQSLRRRRAIYQLAEKHDLYIIEDDPYYFIQLEILLENDAEGTAYQRSLPASYLSLDVFGRVLRLDSASKILAPGLRLGWVTGCAQVIEKFTEQADMSTLAPSGPSQILVHKLLCEKWAHFGFAKYLKDLSLQYQQRRDIMTAACVEHLPSSLCKWSIPSSGMFLWIKILSTHVLPQSFADIEERVSEELEEKGVLIGRGSWFWAGSGSTEELCFRLTFAAAPPRRFEEGIRTFAQVLRKIFAVSE